MPINQGYSAYQRANVTTASQGHLIVLLYEAAVRNLRSAEALFDENDKLSAGNIEKFGTFVQKAQAIITELQVSLDMEKGGEIAKNLMSLYVFFNSELMDASINKNKTKIIFVKQQMNELLKAWRVASNSTANTQTQTNLASNALNIQG